MPKIQVESHRTNRVGWLRAAVLGQTTDSCRQQVSYLGLRHTEHMPIF